MAALHAHHPQDPDLEGAVLDADHQQRIDQSDGQDREDCAHDGDDEPQKEGEEPGIVHEMEQLQPGDEARESHVKHDLRRGRGGGQGGGRADSGDGGGGGGLANGLGWSRFWRLRAPPDGDGLDIVSTGGYHG